MAEVTEIISKDAINGIIQTDEALKKTIASLDSLLTKQKEVDTELNKNKASFEANANAKKKAADNAKQLSLVEQEIAKTQKSLETTQAKLIASTERDVANTKKLAQEKAKLNRETSKTRAEANALAVLRDKEAGTLEKLAAKNKLLTESRKKLNLSTDEGQRRLKIINAQLDTNNNKIKENSDALTKQRLNIGNYQSALDNLVPGFSGFINGIKGATKASLAFIATPLGAILAAIAGAVLLIRNAMNRSETATQKVRLAFSAFTGIVQGLLKYLQPLGEFLIDGLVKGFELVEKGVFKTLSALEKGFRFVGLDEAADNLKGFTDAINESVETSKKLTEAELEYTKAQRESGKLQLQYQKQAEELRQVRDDESLSIQQRINANKELGKILDEQSKNELALGKKALDFANLRIKLEGETTANLDARAAAETELIDIQERITGQRSEQLVNINSLQKESNELKKKEIEITEKQQDKILKNITKSLNNQKRAIKEAEEEKTNIFKDFELEGEEQLDREMQAYIDAEVAKTEALKKETEQRKQIRSAATDIAIQGINALFEFGNIQTQREIERLNEQKARELAIAGDNADKRAAVEAKFEKRTTQLKQKQAKSDKLQALFNIAVNTAVGISSALAKVATIPLVPFIAASGAIQAALVAAQPIPKFALGTNNAPGSGFIAGERGRELMQLSSGSTMMVDSPTFFKGSKYRGATIKSNPETERIMSSVNDMSIINFDTMSLQKENKRGFRRLERAINNSNFKHNKAISQSYKERYLN